MTYFKKVLRFCFLVSLLVIAGPCIVQANFSKLSRYGAIKKSLNRTLTFNTKMQQQGLITGQVLDKSGHPLAYSAVILFRVIDAVIVKRASCDSVGKYRFTGITSGSYRVTASQIGYLKQSSQLFPLTSDSAVNVPAIILSALANQLKEVQVRAKKPLFERRIDRTIVNVESSALTGGGSVIDLLEIAPGVSVDQNQITLKGKQGVTVMIDDKVVKLSASQVSSLLQSMPASSIDKIELISNPSAKYDAEGKGRIINIKTKKGTNLGFNGTVTTGLGIGNFPKASEGLTLNYKLRKLNLFSNYSYQHNKSLNQYLSDKIISGEAPLSYHQDKITHGVSDAHNARLGADYDLNSRNTVGIIGTLNTSTRNSHFLENTLFNRPLTRQRDSSLSSRNNGSDHYKTYGINLNSRHILGPNGHVLVFNADYTVYRSASLNSYVNTNYNADGTAVRNSQDVLNDASIAINFLTAKADYTYPVSKTSKLEAGVKTAFTHSNSNILFRSGILGAPLMTDPQRTNTFDYHENISALYLNYFTKLDKQTDFQGGLRGENTNYSGS